MLVLLEKQISLDISYDLYNSKCELFSVDFW